MKTFKTLDPILGLIPLVCVQEPLALAASTASKFTIAKRVRKLVAMIKRAFQVLRRYHINSILHVFVKR